MPTTGTKVAESIAVKALLRKAKRVVASGYPGAAIQALRAALNNFPRISPNHRKAIEEEIVSIVAARLARVMG